MRCCPIFWRLTLLGLAAARTRALVLHDRRLPDERRDSQKGASLQSRGNITLTNNNGTLDSVSLGLDDGLGVRYVSNITVNGRNFRVVIDTGSSDLWLVPPQDFKFNDTGMSIINSYGGGMVSGTIGYASVEFGGYRVDNQAFNNATKVTLEGVIDAGLDGLLGLSFTGNASDINTRYNQSASEGQPFLFNVFDQTPGQNNFIGISLSRTDDLEDSADASFAINEVDQAYAAVQQAPSLPLSSGAEFRGWRIFVDGLSIDGVDIPLPNSTADAPAGKIVALMDTGAGTSSLPTYLFEAIYSQIPGSRATDTGDYLWTIPCNTTSILSFQIGGQEFPIHPLDLSNVMDGNCYSSFASGGENENRDALLGPTFMRNVYSVFNFGDSISKSSTGDASMQLLSQTDPKAAAADVLNVRMARLSNPTGPPAGSAAFSAAIDDTSPVLNSDSTVTKYATIIIGLLGANLLVVLILVVVGLALCVGRRGKGVSRVRTRKYEQVRDDEDTRPLDSYRGKHYSD
ncbi:aspartic peptidase domain-containing protein [Mycena epipterygia]|nr:aspartic peptidase domain-containing protein [Mycena epipterygia]